MNKKFYKIENDICILSNDIKINDIENFFNIKITKSKLFRSIFNWTYWVHNEYGNNWINFNDLDLKLGEKNE